jgi:phosphatidylglycerophosphatase A
MNPQKKSPAFWIATGLGSGLLQPAPGTWGTLAGLLAGLGVLWAGGIFALLVALLLLAPVSFQAIRHYQTATAAQSEDPSEIVIDEVLGAWVALLAAPLTFSGVIWAFVLFRFFDILKPWPVCWFDRTWKGPAGILADDLMAGLYAAACLIGGRYAGFL